MRISIIIPTYNRAASLQTTLTSVYNQLNLEGCEVIVVDNGSNDNTAEVCRRFIEDHKPGLRYFYEAEPGLLSGRHYGAFKALGEILCFLDDDVELSKSWVDGVRDAFENEEVQLATGPCIPKYEVEPPVWLKYFFEIFKDGSSNCSWLSLIDLGADKKTIDANLVWGLNFCIRKKAFIELEGFHPDSIVPSLQMFQGDGESGLTIKANKQNYIALYHPRIKLFHIISSQRLTLEYFKKRAFYQGVCDSFTSLRMSLDGDTKDFHQEKPTLDLKRIVSFIVQRLKVVKLKFHEALFTPQEVKRIKEMLSVEKNNGYNFHQQAFKNNETVKEWVLKKNYWDYKLPISEKTTL